MYKATFAQATALLLAALSLCGCALKTESPAPEAATPKAVTAAANAPAKTPAPTPSPAPTATPVLSPFSIVWLSDTQLMAFKRPDALAQMGKWIADNRVKENITQVVQTGDAVEHGANPLQWEAFDLCYTQFKNDIPYFAISGNHEPGVREKDPSFFLDRPYVQSIPNERKTLGGMAAYTTFSAGGESFLILGAGWDAELTALDWMDGVLTQYADHTAILLFHSFITPQGRVYNRLLPLYDRLVRAHANVRMVLCGHVVGHHNRIDRFDDDGDGTATRSVSIQLMNYQNLSDRCGQLRLLTFDTIQRTITVTTYSPVTDCYYRDGTHPETVYVMEDAF